MSGAYYDKIETLIGDAPGKWDKHCPLPPPSWVEEEIDKFLIAVNDFLDGDREGCLERISQTRGPQMRDWFIELGQRSGKYRTRKLNLPKPEKVGNESRDPTRSPNKYEEAVFKRDGHRCRYCGIRLISKEFMQKFIRTLDWPGFIKGSKNIERHGIIFATYPYADHVKPWNQGGRTDGSNLVASCGCCNFGKASHTIEQMGIEDPFLRAPKVDGWDGLAGLQSVLKGL
jgi:5-methylcytosine-specific restriction endonuclease McrA